MNANNCLTTESHKYGSIDVLLLGVYNLEVVDSDGQLVERTFRLMSLSKPSIYHEPSSHSTAQSQSSLLTEHNISKLDNICGDINVPLFGPYSEVEQIVANNRLDVMSVLMKVFNQNISSVCKQSLNALCRMCLRYVTLPILPLIDPMVDWLVASVFAFDLILNFKLQNIRNSEKLLWKNFSKCEIISLEWTLDRGVEGVRLLEDFPNFFILAIPRLNSPDNSSTPIYEIACWNNFFSLPSLYKSSYPFKHFFVTHILFLQTLNN